METSHPTNWVPQNVQRPLKGRGSVLFLSLQENREHLSSINQDIMNVYVPTQEKIALQKESFNEEKSDLF